MDIRNDLWERGKEEGGGVGGCTLAVTMVVDWGLMVCGGLCLFPFTKLLPRWLKSNCMQYACYVILVDLFEYLRIYVSNCISFLFNTFY